MSQKTYQVYVLINRMNRRFIGCTEDALKELERHNKGEFRGTKAFKPWRMEWYSDPLSRNDSLRLEESLRHHKTNTQMIHKIIQDHRLGMK